MRIGIIGAGGVGAYYGGMLAHAGHDVVMLARGENLAALRARELEVRTPEGAFTVAVEAVADAESLEGVELAIVAVKAYSLDEVLPAARAVAQGGGAVVAFLNGVESADRLVAGGVPAAAVLGGATYISAARTAPGVVERRSGFQRVLLGELPSGTSPRVEAAVAAFRSAGAEATASAQIQVEIWRKFIFLASISAACGLVRGDIGAVRERPYGSELLRRLVRETAAVARARGVPLPPEEEAQRIAQIEGLAPPTRPSFLLDVLAGGPNELDILSGAVARLGREAGVETPAHDVAVTVLSNG
ncbi:MAG TPA: 2-dehydropantoate 2-reductase [Longimicrobiales bacterium]